MLQIFFFFGRLVRLYSPVSLLLGKWSLIKYTTAALWLEVDLDGESGFFCFLFVLPCS